MGQREAHVRPRQRKPLEGFFAVGVFGRRAAQEFAPCRCIEVQVGHFDDRSDGNGGGLGCRARVTAGFHFPCARAAGRPAGEAEMRDGGDTGQRLAAKAQAGYTLEIFQRRYLAGGVTGKRERKVILGDAAAVVGNADLPDAAIGQLCRDFRRSGVEAVFQQFLEGGGGPVDHFASGDLADQEVGQGAYGGHRNKIIAGGGDFRLRMSNATPAGAFRVRNERSGQVGLRRSCPLPPRESPVPGPCWSPISLLPMPSRHAS